MQIIYQEGIESGHFIFRNLSRFVLEQKQPVSKKEGADLSFSHLTYDRDLLIEHINEAEKLLETSRNYIYAGRDHLKTIRIEGEGCIMKNILM